MIERLDNLIWDIFSVDLREDILNQLKWTLHYNTRRQLAEQYLIDLANQLEREANGN